MTAAAQVPAPEAVPLEPLHQRIWDNVRTGNLGPAPTVAALGIVVLIFAFKAQNFWSPANFQNIITAMRNGRYECFRTDPQKDEETEAATSDSAS